MSKEHEHNFVAEKITTRTPTAIYLGSEQRRETHDTIKETIVLFCTKCGESKKLTVQKEEQSNV